MDSFVEQATALINGILNRLEQLEDKHNKEDRIWFYKLLACNKNESNPVDIEAGITINITVIDCLAAKLLNIDYRQLAKAKIVKDYITQIWKQNDGNMELLHNHIIDDSQAHDFFKAYF